MSECSPNDSSGGYHRPNQPWICGHSRDGTPCALGPNLRGHCVATSACEPMLRDGTWQCNRPTLRGGKCEVGPSPDGRCGCPISTCSPIRSLRSWRGRLVRTSFASALACMALVLSSEWRNEILAPGPLARPHAQLIRDKNMKRCASCHGAGDMGLAQWTTATIGGPPRWQTPQSSLCMECHQTHLNAEFPLSPHSTYPESLRVKTELAIAARDSAELETRAFIPTTRGDAQLACARCHREHHGAEHDLTAISSQQCQTCHVQQFVSLAEGHPEFHQWPHDRRTRIVFDHRSHAGRHFPDTGQSFQCQSCHVPGASGEPQRNVTYDHCAKCHDDGIHRSLAEPLDLVNLPSIDATLFETESISVGEWPQELSQEFDGAISPLLYLMLWADPAGRVALRHFGPHADFMQVDVDNYDDLEAAADLVWALKQFLYDLTVDGSAAIIRRAERLHDGRLSDQQRAALAAGLSVEEVRAMIRHHFPNLERDLLPRQASLDPPYPADMPPQEAAGALHHDTRWQINVKTGQIQVFAAGHANATLASWIELAAHQAQPTGVLQKLLQPTGHGQCISCHSVESAQIPGGTVQVNWTSRPHGQSTPRGFTRFSHAPHMLQPATAECTACHVYDEQADYLSTYVSLNPSVACGNFLSMDRAQCASCHTPRGSGDACTKCHYYHVHEDRPSP